MTRSVRLATATILLLTGFVAVRDAAARLLVRLSPNYVELSAGANGSVGDRIRYVNAGTEAVDITVELSDFDVNVAGDAVEQPPGSSAASLAPYLRISPTQVRAEPGQVVDFRYRIEAPAEFAQLRSMVYFVSRPQIQAARGTSALIVPRLGVPVYLENRGARGAELAITRGEARVEGGEVVLALTIENQGGRNIRPAGAIQVDTENGPRFFQFNEGRSPVLPGHAREWTLKFGRIESPRAVRLRLESAPGREVERVFPLAGGSSQPS